MSESGAGTPSSGSDSTGKEVPLWRDREWMYENYANSDKYVYELVEEAGCAETVFYKWLDRFGIPRRRNGAYGDRSDMPYCDGEWLREKYVEEGLSTHEIADICGCGPKAICDWLDRHGIETRSMSEAGKLRAEKYGTKLEENRVRSIHPDFFTHKNGYVYIQCGVNNRQVLHHRLIATLLVDDLSELDGKHVHHKDRVPWLNYLNGLEVVTPKEHKARHAD